MIVLFVSLFEIEHQRLCHWKRLIHATYLHSCYVLCPEYLYLWPLQTFLGAKVAQQLQTIKESRIDRRNRLSKDVNFKDIHKFGKICSPYRALNTKDVEEIHIPTILPMSQRMMNKGYDPESMNVDTLKNMDFSYGSPDTPPAGDQTGERSKDRMPIKSQTAGTHRRPARLAPLKKTNTVM